MRHWLYLVVAIILAACSAKPDAGKLAAQSAKQYYQYLLEGKYESFIDGHYRPDSIPDSYREQLITNAKMFMSEQKIVHRGIHDIRIVNVITDTTERFANVFLLFSYGDSTNEEVVVPMIHHDGLWYLR